MLSVHQRADSSYLLYRQKVPLALAARGQGRVVFIDFPAMRGDPAVTVTATLGAEIKFSLRTRDPIVAKARTGLAQAHITSVFESIQRGPQPLDFRTTVALAGEVYGQIVAVNEAEPGPASNWSAVKAMSRAIREGRLSVAPALRPTERVAREVEFAATLFGVDLTAGVDARPGAPASVDALESRFGLLTSWVLGRHALDIDAPSRHRLLEQVALAVEDAGQRLKRAAGGDYRPDPQAERYPVFQSAKKPVSADPVSFTSLLNGWWKEALAAGRRKSTFANYEGILRNFVGFIGHDDASRITTEDVIRYKDHRLDTVNGRNGRKLSAKTVKGTDLSCLKSVFDWAVANKKLPTNPASTVTLKVGKKPLLRPKSFTDAEAKALLDAALLVERGRESEKTFNARRWVPWLCAYTGARVGELVQLRKEDIVFQEGLWTLRITPEAGSVKTSNARIVVLHEHLVELGFPAFVQAQSTGHLFLKPARDGDVMGPLQGVRNRLSESARLVVTDPNVAPNHGWRHRFKTVSRNVGIDRTVAHAIQGHVDGDEGDKYGEISLEAQARALARFPRQG